MKRIFSQYSTGRKIWKGTKKSLRTLCLNLILGDLITSIICWYHIWASRTERSKVNKLLSGMNRSGLASYHLANHVHRKENIPFQEWKKNEISRSCNCYDEILIVILSETRLRNWGCWWWFPDKKCLSSSL